MAKNELTTIIKAIKTAFNIHQDQEVAKLLGLSRASLANHKTRKTVPYKEIIDLCKKNNKSLDALLYGGVKTQTKNKDEISQPTFNYEREMEMLKDKLIAQMELSQRVLEEKDELRKENAELRALLLGKSSAKSLPLAKKKIG